MPTDAVPVLPRRRQSRAEQNENRRRLLLASALEVLTEQGYQAMTLEEVAERAGFTRRPVYTLFGSKERLALAVFMQQIVQFSEGMLQVEPSRTLAATMRRLAKVHAEATAKPAFRPIYELQSTLNTVSLHDDAIHQEIIGFLDAQHDRFVGWLGQVCEATGQGFRVPVERAARVIEAGFAGLVQMSFLDPAYGNPELRYDLVKALIAES